MMSKLKYSILILIVSLGSVFAFEAANPYWLAIKPKLKTYLDKNISSSKYSYKIVGPARKMTNFLGNRSGLDIKFSNLNLNGNSMRRTVMASAFDEAGKKVATMPVYVDVMIYKRVLTLKRPVQKGQEITPDNVSSKVIAINPRDAKLYYDASLIQKVAGTNLPAGSAIRMNQVRHEKLVQVGDSIKVANKNKLIVLEFICKAMKSGDVGDTIMVHCPDLQVTSKKVELLSESEAIFI